MPLFMHAQSVDKSAEKVELRSPPSTNRPAEPRAESQLAIEDAHFEKSTIANDGLFEGCGSAQLIADLAKSIILTNAGDSVEAQATRLTWGSLRLLQ